ncbi:FlaD/FlaE family flagellar protein [Natrialba asiatica]|uniref:Flagella accessory C family protein n=1 Tax=Natrialba asiatica (strain ATCC 700177 / DSM 12278 / JCM 9576 / FERM P-10747 / NBRC 102637 / 172P1) TaxID=29540 RepID=M0AKL1_NATA1|nr:FlaD/FlaE family flagellar protein [Natrialba asiatica]ELY98886.1 Flagella accessory C family protein [Natrialba asiatica DSM 12278]
MVLSIIGNILGDGDDRSGSGNGSDDLVGGDLAGSMSDDELMPGTRTDESVSGSSGGSGEGGGDGDLFDDGDLGGGGEEFLDDESMSLDEMGEVGDMDEMGDMGGMDAMDGGGGGGVSSEIESRVEEMENNVGSLSSTVNTVQSENEKISESLDDIEENIRKLLEVYEMVTQGVNPFVEGDSLADSMTAGPGGGAPGSGDFGGESLFDSSGDEVEDEAIDDDIASAEADEFLDESIIDDEDGTDFEEDGDLEDDLSMDSEEDDDSDLDGEMGGDEDLSFDELKSEYESGDANWDEEAGAGAETADEDSDSSALEMDETESQIEPESDLETDADDLGFDEGEAPTDTETTESAGDSTTETADGLVEEADGASQNAAADTVAPWDDGGRPYLETIPSEYDTEFVVMDWLEYLVDELGLNGAARTLRFYDSIHWVSGSVESHLQTVLNGFGGGPDIGDPDPHSSLGVDHKRSLWWISQIATPEKKRRPFDAWVDAEEIAVQQAMAAAEQHQPEATETDDVTEDEPVAVEEAPTDAPPADAEGGTTAAAADEELAFDEETDVAPGDSDETEVELELEVDVDGAVDGDTATEATDDATADDSDDLELEFTTDEPLDPGTDPFGKDGDGVDDEATESLTDEPSHDRERSDEFEQGERADAAALETNDAQKIFIEEAEESASSAETGGAETSAGTESMTHPPSDGQRTELAEPEVTDGGQMIWVDSDVVLSASGERLRNARGNAGRIADAGGRADQAQPAKPLVSDEPADLDGWQVERIKLLLAPEDLEHDRPRDRDRTHSRTRDDRVSDTERTTDDHTHQQ